MNRLADGGGGGGEVVHVNIAEFRALVKGMEHAHSELTSTHSQAKAHLDRLWLSTSSLNGLTDVIGWVEARMPTLRRHLATAEEISNLTPGMPNAVEFGSGLLPDISPAEARKQARRAAKLAKSTWSEDATELTALLEAYGNDPYFAREFALHTSPRDYAEMIRGLTTYESLPGNLTKEDYEALLDNLAGTLSLASRLTGDMAMPPQWQQNFVEMMAYPPMQGKDPEQARRDQDNSPALWLLLARGHWSTSFLKDTTTRLSVLDKDGHYWIPPGCDFIAISPDGKRFMDPMVALMGALVNNPEAAHWAFTQDGTTEVPFPKDGEGATGDVEWFIHHMLAGHRFTDEENGPATVLMALRAAMAWQNDPAITDSIDNLKKSMEQQKEVWDEKPFYQKWGHTILDVLGLIPLIGEPADGVNAAWYGLEGDWVNAGLSAASLIPLAGGALGLGRVLARGSKVAELLRMVDRFGNDIDPGSPLAKALLKGRKVEDGVYTFPNAADLSKALHGKHPNMEFRSRELSFTTDATGEVTALKVYVDGKWVPVDFHGNNLHLATLKVGDSPWDLIPRPRGDIIEVALAKTEYKDFEHLPNAKGVDFYNDGAAVSLKTMDPPNAKARNVRANIDDLAAMMSRGTLGDGRKLTSVELDLRVRIGQENSPQLLEIIRYAKDKGVQVDVSTY